MPANLDLIYSFIPSSGHIDTRWKIQNWFILLLDKKKYIYALTVGGEKFLFPFLGKKYSYWYLNI